MSCSSDVVLPDCVTLMHLHFDQGYLTMCNFSGEVEVKEAEVAAVERDEDAARLILPLNPYCLTSS